METLLSYMLTALFLLSVFHYIYESIIVPTERLVIRDNLFKIRDDLRAAHSDFNEADKKAFKVLHNNGVNFCLNNLGKFTFVNQFRIIQAIENNPALKKEAESKARVIEDSDNEVIQTSFTKYKKEFEKAHMLNSGGLVFYIVPFVILFALLSMIVKSTLVQRFRAAVDNSSLMDGCKPRRHGPQLIA